MKQAMLTLLIVFILPSLVFAQEVENENTPSEQIYPSIQDDTENEDNSLSTDQLLQQENQWDEVERIIMGLDEEEYAEVFQLDIEEKVDYLEHMKKNYVSYIYLAVIPGLSFLGLHYYLNADWEYGVAHNLTVLLSLFSIIQFPCYDFIYDIPCDTENLVLSKIFGAFSFGFLIGSFHYSWIHTTTVHSIYNHSVENSVNYLLEYSCNDFNKNLFTNYLETNKKDRDLAIILSSIPITNILGLHFYFTQEFFKGILTNSINSAAFTLLTLDLIQITNDGFNSINKTSFSIYSAIFLAWYLYGIAYSIWETDYYNHQIDNQINTVMQSSPHQRIDDDALILQLEELKINRPLNIAMAAIPITNLLGIQYYLGNSYIRAVITHLLTGVSATMLLFRYGIIPAGEDGQGYLENEDKVLLESVSYSLLGLSYLFGLFYSIFEVDWYNQKINQGINNIQNNSIYDKISINPLNYNLGIIPLDKGLMMSFLITF